MPLPLKRVSEKKRKKTSNLMLGTDAATESAVKARGPKQARTSIATRQKKRKERNYRKTTETPS